jgi:predicted nucleotidyltransferase
MIREIDERREAIEALCQRFGVRRLDLFGSAATGGFNPRSSDLDFLVEFDELPPREYANAYFGLLEELQKLFRRDVDLVVSRSVKNPYLLESIQRSRTLLYAA